MREPVGTVAELRLYPVKSMLGEELSEVALTARGVDGDRRYAVIDVETGKVVSVKRPARWGRMFEITASANAAGTVVVTLPNGEARSIDDPKLPKALSELFGRDVTIAEHPPDGATFDEAWRGELKGGAAPYFGIPSRIDEEGEELVDGGQFMSEQGSFFNFGAVHIVTTSTTRRLTELAPDSRFDAHRFRPNVVVDTPGVGFVETAWQGRTLAVGDVHLAVSFTVPRCVMTTLAQGDLPADPEVLRTITQHNSVDPGWGTKYPCVGVYADVVRPGAVPVGAPVELLD